MLVGLGVQGKTQHGILTDNRGGLRLGGLTALGLAVRFELGPRNSFHWPQTAHAV